jgi:hypothetical protein
MGRGDRRGAFRAASAVFFLRIGAWLLGPNHVGTFDAEQTRLFSAIGVALYEAASLWLAYLGLEPYIRRFSPDSLIGWQRLVAGGWRDARVGRDVMIGIGAGLAMTLVFALHNLIPPLFGRPEPMPVVTGDLQQLMATRYAVALLLGQVEAGLSAAMLGTAGFVVFRIFLKHRWAAVVAAVLCYVWVVLQGMFNPGWPLLDLICGLIITTMFVAIIGWQGLLATIVTFDDAFPSAARAADLRCFELASARRNRLPAGAAGARRGRRVLRVPRGAAIARARDGLNDAALPCLLRGDPRHGGTLSAVLVADAVGIGHDAPGGDAGERSS